MAVVHVCDICGTIEAKMISYILPFPDETSVIDGRGVELVKYYSDRFSGQSKDVCQSCASKICLMIQKIYDERKTTGNEDKTRQI